MIGVAKDVRIKAREEVGEKRGPVISCTIGSNWWPLSETDSGDINSD